MRVRDKPLRRQPGALQIAPRQAQPRNVKLANNTRRNSLKTTVQNINPILGTDGQSGRIVVDASNMPRRSNMRRPQHMHLRRTMTDRIDRGFGRAVKIGDPRDLDDGDLPRQLRR